MTQPFVPRGTWTALVTPFTQDGKLDEARFRRLVEFQLSEGINGLVPCGTTGESPTLEWEEHQCLVRAAVQVAAGRVGVLAGTGSNSTAEAVMGTRDAQADGASAALLVDCYYNGPSSLELRTEYYERVLEQVPDLPIVPYVIPGRTGCALNAADLAILHRQDPRRVPAVKSATGDLERMREDRRLAGDSLAILSGDDEMTRPMIEDPGVRAAGAISVMSNIVPGAMARLVRAASAGEPAEASRVLAQILPLCKLVVASATGTRELPGGAQVEVKDKFRNPLPVKTMMAGLGLLEGLCRPPLGKMTRPAVEACRSALGEVWRQSPELLRPLEEAFDINVAARLADDVRWSGLVA